MKPVVEEGEIVTVTMRVRVPAAATEEQLNEWLHHYIAQDGDLPNDNPLSNDEPEAWASFGFEWKRDGLRGISEEFDYEDLPDGGKRYRVRHREVRV